MCECTVYILLEILRAKLILRRTYKFINMRASEIWTFLGFNIESGGFWYRMLIHRRKLVRNHYLQDC